MKKYNVIFISLLLLLSFSTLSLSKERPNFTKGKGLGNIQEDANLIHEIVKTKRKARISSLNDESIIWYQEKDSEFIKKTLKHGNNFLEFSRKLYALYFVALLEMNNLDYNIINYCGSNQIRIYYRPEDSKFIHKELEPKLSRAVEKGLNIN